MRNLLTKETENKYLNILKKSKTTNITFHTFRGSWSYSIFKYLVKKHAFEFANDNHILGYITIPNILIDKEHALRDTKIQLDNLFDIESENLTDLTYKITKIQNKHITFILGGFSMIFAKKEEAEFLIRLIKSLKDISPQNISFIFINTSKIDKTEQNILSSISHEFFQKEVWQEEIQITSEDISHIYAKYTKEAVSKKVRNLSLGDPALAQIISRSLNNKKYVDTALNYETIGIEILNNRFKKLVNNKDFDKNYLKKTGVLDNNYKPKNILFKKYIKDHLLKNRETIDPISSDENIILDKLTGQEAQLFNLLRMRMGIITSKDEIAQTIWGNNWEDVYSDWAIDKLVSTLRMKLNKYKYSKKLKTIRNKGIILIQ